ncbi:MAG: hypothetical protein BMS9Abin13_325 [Patescibacteria group bacterium]|nr:MAG: hypothetical protein BMS9Abin13_325 [Patescibacteria group bacterium]
MVVVDVETSGLVPRTYALLSIGAVDFDDPERQFYEECRAWDGALISEEALAVNGFTEEDAWDKNKKSLEEVMAAFKEWLTPIRDITLAGQNPSFDRDFVNDSFRRAGVDMRFPSRTVDMHSLVFSDHLRRGISLPIKNRRSDINLDAALVYVGIPEEPKPHNALVGAKVEAEAFSRIIRGAPLLPEFKKFLLPEYLINTLND